MKNYILVLLLSLFSSFVATAQCEATEPSDFYACESDGDGIEIFDLTQKDAAIIGDNPIDDFFVSYHLNDFSAEDNTQILPSLYEIQNPFFQIIFARLNQISTGCFNIVPLKLKVEEPPIINIPNNMFSEDTDNDGIVFFDLHAVEPEVLEYLTGGPYLIHYHLTEDDAENGENHIPLEFNDNYEINTMEDGDCQIIYVRVVEFPSMCHSVTSFKIGIFMDPDFDGLTSQLEDLNENGNYDDDDTDDDGIPNYLDNDDDNDLVETSIERMGDGYGFPMTTGFVDTDGDLIENYLDDDDDGDGVLTKDEDYNNNGSPLDDDTNNNTIPDFVEAEVALSINDAVLDTIKLFPSPVSSNITLQFPEVIAYLNVSIVSIDGKVLISNIVENKKQTTIDLEYLNAGVYFVSFTYNNRSFVKKIIKE